MFRRPASLVVCFLLLGAVAAHADVTVTGILDKALTRGQIATVQAIINSTALFDDDLAVQIATSAGLLIKDTRFTPGGWTCTDSKFGGKTIRKCSSPSGKVTIPAGGSVKVDIDVEADDTSLEIPTIRVQLVGDGRSGAKVLEGLEIVEPKKPIFTITKYPDTIVQTAASQGSTVLRVKNAGNARGNLTITPGVGLSVFASNQAQLDPDEFVDITLNADAGIVGYVKTDVTLTGDGWEDPPVRVRVAIARDNAPASGTPAPKATTTRTTVPVGSSSSTPGGPEAATPVKFKLGFTNSGSAPVRGALSADRSFIVLPDTAVSIDPGQTKDFDLAIDTSELPEPSDTNSEAATVSLIYLTTEGTTSRTSTTVVATTPGPVTTVTGPLSAIPYDTCCNGLTYLAGDAILLTGVGHIFGSVGLFVSDLAIYPKAIYGGLRAFQDVTSYYTPLGTASTSAKTVAFPAIAPPNVASFGDVTTSVYGATQQIGTLQLRAPNFMLDLVGANANVFNVSNAAGTYGSSVPTFHAYRSVFGNDAVILPGLRKDATSHTNIYVQEASGRDITATIDFYNAAGSTVGSTTVDLPAWSAKQLGSDRVPAGTSSATVRVTAGGGSVHAYATPVDEASGDTWVATDWRRVFGYDSGATVVIPVAGALHGLNNTYFKTDVSLTNGGNSSSAGVLRFYNRTGEVIDRTINLNAHETKTYDDVTTTLFGVNVDHAGFMTYSPNSNVPVVLTARNYTVTAGSPATYGTAIPAMPATDAIFVATNRDKARIGGIDDASLDTVGARQGATFRSNFGLAEVAGQTATVKVTLNYRLGATRTVVDQAASATYNLPAHGWLLVGNMANAILGANRTKVGDLRDMVIEFEVTGGAGKVIPFVSSVDNGTGDSIFRSE